jgi:hypothetical protein
MWVIQASKPGRLILWVDLIILKNQREKSIGVKKRAE